MTANALHPHTVAVSAGRPAAVPDGPLNVPIVPASALHAGGPSGYARDGAPGWTGFEQALGRLEGGQAVAFASGMAAVTAVLRLLPAGARIVAPTVVYMRVRDALTELHDAGALRVVWVDIADTDAVRDACAAADALWIESPTNPLLDVADLPALCGDARGRGLLCVVDSTLATPFGQRPLEHGADVVVHSATKLIGGHTDLLLGAAVAREHAVADRLIHGRESTGGTPGALEVFLALRGLRTLPLRLERAQGNAIVLAARLAGHPEVTQVRYRQVRPTTRGAVRAARRRRVARPDRRDGQRGVPAGWSAPSPRPRRPWWCRATSAASTAAPRRRSRRSGASSPTWRTPLRRPRGAS